MIVVGLVVVQGFCLPGELNNNSTRAYSKEFLYTYVGQMVGEYF